MRRYFFIMFKGKKIFLAITGSIAAYKSITLLRMLTSEGAEVRIIMTPSAKEFVTPLTLSTLSNHKVLHEYFEEGSWNNHVLLGRWADLMIIAPLTCNTLGKMANGICDNLLLAIYFSATCPVIIAPAMDEDMWMHPSTIKNLERIKSFGNIVLPVENGSLASGLIGQGRMTEPDNIINHLKDFFCNRPLKGKKALVTAGPTFEALDPVRFIGNHSSGKMGIAIAEELYSKGAEVTLILGPSSEPVIPLIPVIHINTANEMYNQCEKLLLSSDIIIMAAAVADYTPVKIELQKLKKKDSIIDIKLTRTKDILKTAGESKRNDQVLVGFALETENEKENALKKLSEKNADFIILNSIKDNKAVFGGNSNKITIFGKKGQEFNFNVKSKKEVAKDIVETIINYING